MEATERSSERSAPVNVVNFSAVRLANDTVKHAEMLIQEAEFHLGEDNPEESASFAVEAWVILNAAAVVIHRVKHGRSILNNVDRLRKKILAIGGTMQALGYEMKVVPEQEMLMVFRVTPKRGTDGEPKDGK